MKTTIDHISNAYDFSFEGMNSHIIKLSDFKGRVIMLVNTASECGFTKQYKELEVLYNLYKEKGLVVIAVPSNDFGKQEPGSNEAICRVAKKKFNVTFPIMKKTIVKGKEAHPFYVYAAKEKGFLARPWWNFHKYIIDKQGYIVEWFLPITSPLSARVKSKIEGLL